MSICNKNFASANKFLVTIGDGDNAFETSCKAFMMPSVNTTVSQLPNRGDIVSWQTGSGIIFDDVIMTFHLDEQMANYTDIYTWLRRNAMSDVDNEDGELDYREIALIQHSNQNEPSRKIIFKDSFPYAMTPLNFDVTLDANSPIEFEVSFKFTGMYIENLEGERIID